MGNRSTIERLDPDIVAEVTRLIKGGRTIDEITTHLRGMDQDVSRSAVGRYVKNARKAMEDLGKAQEVAKVWVDRLEKEPNGDVARLLPEMLQVVAFNTIEGMSEADAKNAPGPGDIMFMAKALQSLASSRKVHMDVELKLRQVREETRRQLLAEQDKQLDALNQAGGITADTKTKIRQALGIV